jgi:hypothetical protein
MAIDDPNGELLSRPLVPGAWGPGSVVPPPPTGPLAPPPPPPLTPDVPATGEPAQPGAHRVEAPAPVTVDAAAAPDGQLPEGLRLALVALLSRVRGRLQDVFDQYRAGVTTPAEVVASGAAVSEGAAADLTLLIRTILGEPWTGSPVQARLVAGDVRVLMRAPGLSTEACRHLTAVRGTLLELADSEAARQQEQALLEANSALLERELRTGNGVFVCTYPHYWRYPHLAEVNRRLLRLGTATDAAWQRVLDQARAAGVPEDPVLVRVYVAADPVAAAKAFHRLLDGADHARAGIESGRREWFATTLEFLDEIAATLGSEIKTGAAAPVR